MTIASRAATFAAMLREIELVRKQFGCAQLTVLLQEDVPQAQLQALADAPGVTCVWVQSAMPAFRRPSASAPSRGALRLRPSRASPMVLLGGSRHLLPMRQLLRLYRSGARHVVELEGIQWRRHSLARCIAYRLLRAGGLRIVESIDRLGGMQGRSSGLARDAAAKALRGVRRIVPTTGRMGRRRDVGSADLAQPALLEPRAFHPNRVLMLNSALAWGGAERQLVNTMVGVSQRGWDVQLACDHLGRVPDSDFFAPELQRQGLSFAPIQDLGRVQAVDAFVSGLGAQIEQRLRRLPAPFDAGLWPYVLAMLAVRPAVVHAWQDQTNVMAGVAAALVGVPRVVLSTRNVAPHRFSYHQPHMRSAYGALNGLESVRLVNNSRAGAADYARWLDIPETRIAVVHNGFDFDAASPVDWDQSWQGLGLPIPPGAPIVGSMFRFYAEKDPLLWIETAARVAAARPDCHFLIAGTGPLLHTVRDGARRHGFADRLHLPGALRGPYAALRAMAVFLLTSRFEGLPNVLVEAQALGVPVVSTRAGGSAETFVHGETGWLVDERSPSALAERVLSVLEDRAWLERCRVEAPLLARDRFGIGRMVDETIALYA